MLEFLKKILRTTKNWYTQIVVENKYDIPNLPKINIILTRLSRLRQIRAWVKSGSSTFPPHVFKQKVVKSYAKKFSIEIFLETGTFLGDMVDR